MNVRSLFKLLLVLSLSNLPFCLFAQNASKASVHTAIQHRTDEIYDSLVHIRRDLHMFPELSEKEIRTSSKVAVYLRAIGLEVKTNVGGYGVIGILKGSENGKRIAWRVDMDALSSVIDESLNFKSKNPGVTHICGHDIHTVIGLGIANVLASQKAHLKGTVYFIFQPSEENYKGAKAMLDDKAFEMIRLDETYALHIAPMPSGTIATKSEWLYANHKTLKLSLKNSAQTESAIVFLKQLILGLQNVKPESKFWDVSNLQDPEIGLGNPNTIFNDYVTVKPDIKIAKTETEVTLSAFVSSSNAKLLDSIVPFLKNKIEESDYARDLKQVEYSFERVALFNDPELTSKTMTSIAAIYGHQHVVPLYGTIPDNRSDDFAYFQQKFPGVYYFLGGSNFEKGVISMPHAPNFAVDESCIKTGVQFFSSMILERLNDQTQDKMKSTLVIKKERQIKADLKKVWTVLTDPKLIEKWLGVKATSKWKPGSDIAFSFSWDGKDYVDKGKIIRYENEKTFSYSYWSAFSGLPDEPKNYSKISFDLTADGTGTKLTLTHTDFATETMYQHSDKNWEETLDEIVKLAEN